MGMVQYHAVMLDETRCEFGVTFEAEDQGKALDYLSENYPESIVDEMKTVTQWDRERHDREVRLYAGDDDGRDWDAQAAYDDEWR